MSKIPQHITEAIEKYRTEGPVALARILEAEHNSEGWSEPVTFDELMADDEREYQEWLARQNTSK